MKLKTTPPRTSVGAGSRSQLVQFEKERRIICLCKQAQTNLFLSDIYKLYGKLMYHLCISVTKSVIINRKGFSRFKSSVILALKNSTPENESCCCGKHSKDSLGSTDGLTSSFAQCKSSLPTCRKLGHYFLKACSCCIYSSV